MFRPGYLPLHKSSRQLPSQCVPPERYGLWVACIFISVARNVKLRDVTCVAGHNGRVRPRAATDRALLQPRRLAPLFHQVHQHDGRQAPVISAAQSGLRRTTRRPMIIAYDFICPLAPPINNT